MRKDEKKGLVFGFFTLIIILYISIFISFYLLLPKDKLSKDIKDYYLKSSISYFEKEAKNSVSLDLLIKKGYAKKKQELKDYKCNYKESELIKDKDLITLKLNCKNHTNDITIKIKGDEKNDN
ncbi:MAG: hypothetical protein IJB82_00940 [Bacilli bacterium]|nr:hypothetical protein [Bacilli bacterium]